MSRINNDYDDYDDYNNGSRQHKDQGQTDGVMECDYYDCTKVDEIMLEPRLMEYLKKKKYFKENDIDGEFLTKEFGITDRDVMKLRAYMRGDKKGYNDPKHQDMIDPNGSFFPSAKLKKDPRLDRIKQKQKRETDASQQRNNYGDMKGRYDMYRNDRPFASAYGDDFKSRDFDPREWIDSRDTNNGARTYAPGNDLNFQEMGQRFNANSREEVQSRSRSNPNVAQPRPERRSMARLNTYTQPRSIHNGYLPNQSVIESDPHSVDAIIGELDSYRNKINTPYNSGSMMDLDHKVVLPNGNCNERRGTENHYKHVPNMTGGLRDIDTDTYMKFGSAPSKAKSLGHRNPAEHYFSYISNDIQDVQHVVNSRGMPSRSLNRQIARPQRAVMQ